MQTDKYTQHSKKIKELQGYGIEVEPEDINLAYVPLDKFAKDNLSKVQESIKERFSLEQAGDDEGGGTNGSPR